MWKAFVKSRKDTNWEIKTYGPSFQEFRVRDTYPRVVDGNEIMKMVEIVKKRILRREESCRQTRREWWSQGPLEQRGGQHKGHIPLNRGAASFSKSGQGVKSWASSRMTAHVSSWNRKQGQVLGEKGRGELGDWRKSRRCDRIIEQCWGPSRCRTP